METFLDGGLFEIFIAMAFAVFLNYIFLKRYLLIIFSVFIIASPLLLFFVQKNELFFWLVSICLFNAVLLVVLLWKVKIECPMKPLFFLEKMKLKLSGIQQRVNIFFKNKWSKSKV